MSLRQIANSLALSITTVSRALGGHSDVSDATRLRITREAERIGYVPNEMARRLQKGRADAIGFVIPGGPEAFDDSFFLKIIQGAWSRLEDLDMDLLVMSAPQGQKEVKLYRRLVEGRRVDGLILTRVREQDDERVNYLLDTRFPFVTLSAGKFDNPRIVSLDVDNHAAFRLALRRLVDLGHSTVACGGPRDIRYSALRLDAFHAVCAELGIEGVEINRDASLEGGERIVADIADHCPDVTALVCNADRVGAGAMREMMRRGLVPGRDLSLICFGDSQLTRLMRPRITVLKLPTEDMAARAIDLLVRLRDGVSIGALPDERAELVLRDTDGPAPGR